VLLSRTGVVLGLVLVTVAAGAVVRDGAVGFVPTVGAAVMRGPTVVDDGFGGMGVVVARGLRDGRRQGIVNVDVVLVGRL
jgi:hypothetical protein